MSSKADETFVIVETLICPLQMFDFDLPAQRKSCLKENFTKSYFLLKERKLKKKEKENLFGNTCPIFFEQEAEMSGFKFLKSKSYPNPKL